jgi:glycosyltransferase involved in cell wall biosynthesis
MASDEIPELTLDIVGDGPLMEGILDAVAKWRLESKVRVHGAISNQKVQELLANSDIFVQHSVVDPETGDEEGMPVAILEAMAAGLPVVSTLHAGIPEAVENGVSGFLVSERDTAKMAQRIVAIARTSGLGAEMGRRGWQIAKERFTWDRERRELSAILEKACGIS